MPIESTTELEELLRNVKVWRKTGYWPEFSRAKDVLAEYLKATGEIYK